MIEWYRAVLTTALISPVRGKSEQADHPAKIYKAGDTFQVPSGCLHRVSRNPASTGNTKPIPVVREPRSKKEILT
jgi:hypothetical protein